MSSPSLLGGSGGRPGRRGGAPSACPGRAGWPGRRPATQPGPTRLDGLRYRRSGWPEGTSMADGDGNGWVVCALGHRHWGKYGAAGLLASAAGPDGQASVLLIHRASWTQHPGTWGPPGGARDSHESAAGAALREAAEECAVPPEAVRIHGLLDDDHGGWSYQTLIADTGGEFDVYPASPEAPEVAWVPEDRVESLPLHPGFAETWPVIRDGHGAGDRDRGRRQRDGLPRRRLVAGPRRGGGPAVRGARRARPGGASRRCPRTCPRAAWTAGSPATSWSSRGRPGRRCPRCVRPRGSARPPHSDPATTPSPSWPPRLPGGGWWSPPTGSCAAGPRPPVRR